MPMQRASDALELRTCRSTFHMQRRNGTVFAVGHSLPRRAAKLQIRAKWLAARLVGGHDQKKTRTLDDSTACHLYRMRSMIDAQ